MSVLTHHTWVVIADSEKALFLRNETDAQNPDLVVVEKDEQDNPKDIDQSANRPGRRADGGPGQKSALDDTDWHELAKDRFAADLADKLYKKAHAGAFKRLVLVAPAKTLGVLRHELHREVTDMIVAEVDKTLTNHPIDEIEKLLTAELKQG